MKPNIHPKCHKITYQPRDGTPGFQMWSTYGKDGDIFYADTHPGIHPAWTKKNMGVSQANSTIKEYYRKFSGISSMFKVESANEQTTTTKIDSPNVEDTDNNTNG